MIQRIDAPVSVTFFFNHKTRRAVPVDVLWEGRVYPVIKIGLHHTYRRGRTLYHVFSVESPSLFFRLVLDTDTLFWRVEEIADGESN